MARAQQERELALQCVAELERGCVILDAEVSRGMPWHEVQDTIQKMQHLLTTLDGLLALDGREP